MIGAISTALTGLFASSKRVEASASNIANASTPGYTPLTTVLATNKAGGVRAENTPSAIQEDQIDLTSEAINLKIAEISYKANLAVLETAQDMAREAGRLFDKKA